MIELDEPVVLPQDLEYARCTCSLCLAFLDRARIASESKENIPDDSDEPCARDDVEYARCTCLDRARVALEQPGQVHCAIQMKELQLIIDEICRISEQNSNDPVALLDSLADLFYDWRYVGIGILRKR